MKNNVSINRKNVPYLTARPIRVVLTFTSWLIVARLQLSYNKSRGIVWS